MEIHFPIIYFPGKEKLLELGFEARSEGTAYEFYDLWVEGQKLFLTYRPNEKRWTLGSVACYPTSEEELKIFIRTLIKPVAIEVK